MRLTACSKKTKHFSYNMACNNKFFLLKLVLFMTGILAGINLTTGDDSEDGLTGSNGLLCYVKKKGGTIRCSRRYHGAGEGEGSSLYTKEIRIKVGQIQEVDASGNSVGKHDSYSDHQVNPNTDITFTVSHVLNYSLPMNDPNSNVTADCGVYTSGLAGVTGASMILMVCMINTNGTLVLGDEKSNVTAGEMKYTVEIDNWPWCGCSGDQAGTYLDMEMTIQIPGSPGGGLIPDTNPEKNPITYSLGQDATVDFSVMVNIDGIWRDMPSGYPGITQHGVNTIEDVRFYKFNQKAVYDPTINVGYTYNGDPPGTGETPSDSVGTLAPFNFLFLLQACILYAATIA